MATRIDRPAPRAELSDDDDVTIRPDARPVSLADAVKDWSKIDHLPSRQEGQKVGRERPVRWFGSLVGVEKRRLPDGTDDLAPRLSFPEDGTRVLALTPNPILKASGVRTVDPESITAPTVLVRSKADAKREIRDFRRKQSADELTKALTQDTEIFALSKGQFGVLSVIQSVLGVVGPCHMAISSWTAARKEILALDDLRRAGIVQSCRWILDATFVNRDPEAAAQIRQSFGYDCIRITNIHAKIYTFSNEMWKVVLESSANLNSNSRVETFAIKHDPEKHAFLTAFLDNVWAIKKGTLIDDKPRDIRRFFTDEL